MNPSVTKKIPPSKTSSVIILDKFITAKNCPQQQNYKCKYKNKNMKGAKVPKPNVARKGLSFVAVTQEDKVDNSYDNITVPKLQVTTLPNFQPEIIVIDSDNSDESKDDDDENTNNRSITHDKEKPIANKAVAVKLEHPDFLEGLTVDDFDYDLKIDLEPHPCVDETPAIGTHPNTFHFNANSTLTNSLVPCKANGTNTMENGTGVVGGVPHTMNLSQTPLTSLPSPVPLAVSTVLSCIEGASGIYQVVYAQGCGSNSVLPSPKHCC